MSTISVTNINDGDAVTAASVNNQINTIVNDYNGGITAANLASNAVTDAKITANNLLTTKVSNTVKFSVYRSAALNSASSATVVAFDTKTYDTGTNVDVATNKGRFTAPSAGFYHFSATAANTAAGTTATYIYLYKNGTKAKTGTGSGAASPAALYCHVSGDLQLAANDYVEIAFIGGGGSAMNVGATELYFDGFLLSSI